MVSFVGILHVLTRTLHAIGSATTYFSGDIILTTLQRSAAMAALGLTINIFGTLAYAFLYGRVRRIVHDMEWSYNEIVCCLHTDGGTDDADTGN
jgi:hypothetical protein